MLYVIPAGTKVTVTIQGKPHTTKLRQQVSFEEHQVHSQDKRTITFERAGGMAVALKDVQTY